MNSNETMKILALGATGAIGSSLVKTLAAKGHNVTVTSRSPRRSQANTRYLLGNARDDAFILSILNEQWDAIIDFMVYDTPTFANRVKKLLQATKQYVFLSTGRVFASCESALQESSPRLLDVCRDAEYISTDEYALTKARQEDLLRASGHANWTIARPYITFGAARLQLGPLEKEAWLYRALQGRSIVFCDALMDRETTVTDGADVAGMLAGLVGNEHALGEDFNLTNGISLSWRSVLETYLSTLAQNRGKKSPVVLLNLNAFCETTNSAQVLYDRMYNRRFDTTKISSFYNISDVRQPRDALAEYLHLLLSQTPEFGPINWRAEGLRDRAVREHARLAELSGQRASARYLAYRHLPITMMQRLRLR